MTSRAGVAWRAVRLAGGIGFSTASYYLLRALGLSVFTALVVGALTSAVPPAFDLARGRRPEGVAAFWTAMVFASLAVALVPGGERFLLAKESLLTGTVGVWFLLGTRFTQRPLAYRFSRPLIEGRLGWPGDWEGWWARDAAFRRMWRNSSRAWGVGTLLDAVARVVLAYTLPPDAVPALGTALFVVTCVVLNVGTTVYYARCGVLDRRSRFHRTPAPTTAPTSGGA